MGNDRTGRNYDPWRFQVPATIVDASAMRHRTPLIRTDGGTNESDKEAGTHPEASITVEGWPIAFRGITESLVSTLGPNGRWNIAPLGLQPPRGNEDEFTTPKPSDTNGSQVTAKTWGRTRTSRNFTERGNGYVQFTRDPIVFVEAALSIVERDDPILPSADGWVEITVERTDSGTKNGTEWTTWQLIPETATINRETVPIYSRGYGAVVEASIAASRLDVSAYDTDELNDRIDYFETVAHRCGTYAHRVAFERLRELVDND